MTFRGKSNKAEQIIQEHRLQVPDRLEFAAELPVDSGPGKRGRFREGQVVPLGLLRPFVRRTVFGSRPFRNKMAAYGYARVSTP